MDDTFRRDLLAGASELGIQLSAEQLKMMELQADLVTEHNERAGLTEIKTASEMAIKHFVDSLTCMHVMPPKGTVADIGSGGGFPGVPIAIMNRDLKVTLLESSVKKADFLRILNSSMGDLFTVDNSRAEELARGEGRDSFDIVVARALARMSVLLEYCLPLVRKNGMLIAMKGPSVQDELTGCKRALKELGGVVEKVEEMKLPLTGDQRRLVIVRKTQHTPAKYPRKMGTAAKNPL